MTPSLSEHVRADERGEMRLDSLEQRTIQVENKLLYAQKIALEKRVQELEASLKESNDALKESNEECNKLRQTVAHMKSTTLSNKEESIERKEDGLNYNNNNYDEIPSDLTSDLISTINKEEEIIYERILKLVENMKSDCQKAINMKIPTESQLPMRQGSMKAIISSKSPSPTEGLISPSRRSPSTSISVMTNSRSVTPSGAISPPNTTPSSHIPTKSPTSPNKTSHIPSRSNTPVHSNSINVPVATSLNKKQRQRTGSCCIPTRTNTPPPSSIQHNITTGIPSGIPSNLSKMQYRRPAVTC